MFNPWPNQVFAVNEVLAKIAQGYRRILVTAPPGAGKTFVMALLFKRWIVEDSLMCGLYANRKLLLDQLSAVMEEFGIPHGMRASHRGVDTAPLLQISSIQTEASRGGLRRRKCKQCKQAMDALVWKCPACGFDMPGLDDSLYLAQRVVIDEAHLNGSPQMQHVMDAIITQGGVCVGFTGTPIDLGHIYETMVVAGTPSELRRYGAIVPAVHYAPDEPDLNDLGRLAQDADLTEEQATKAVMTNGIFGRVLQWFTKLNPRRCPTLLFAPGVRESLWFAEQFRAAGIPSAHIDGEEVWLDGSFRRTGGEAREEVITALRRGVVTVLCNRFVLREGIDLPFVRHVIAANIFSSIQSYLQALPRGGRADNDPVTTTIWGPKTDYIVQDHGGNYHRYGSLNADRDWNLKHSAILISSIRKDRLRHRRCVYCGAQLTDVPACPACGKNNEVEQRVCPECARVIFGRRCPCGYTLPMHRSRMVVQQDGTLVEVSGDIYKPRRICKARNGAQRWVKVYFRCKNGKKRKLTFKQAFALFAKENQWGWPDLRWPYMPLQEVDHYRAVADVPYEQLVPTRKAVHDT